MLRQAVLMTMLMLIAFPLAAGAQESPAPEGTEPAMAAEPEPMAEGGSDAATAAIDRGLNAYWRRNWSAAQVEFQAALDADPQSAAAAFYLGYAIYKQAELSPFHPDKERAKQMFARAFELDPTFSPTFQRSGN